MKKLPHVCLMLLASFSAAHSQKTMHVQESAGLDIGGNRFTIGMPQAVVLNKLGDEFRLQKMENQPTGKSSTWFASSKEGPPFSAVASVDFTDGKLSGIVKYFDDHEDTGLGFSKALYFATKELLATQSGLCAVSYNSVEEQDFEGKTVFIDCGTKYLRIDSTDAKTAKGGSISLFLRQPTKASSDVRAPNIAPDSAVRAAATSNP